jgi:signal transduction histidine kinase
MRAPGRRNLSLTPRERLAAAEAERARWASELHDETLQGFISLRMFLAAIEGADPIAAQELIGQAIIDLEREAEKLRSLIVDIRPVALDQLGIAAAIEALADRVEKPKLEVRTAVELAAAGGRLQARLDGEREVAIYRIVQGAVDNCVKHAAASRIAVEVIESEERGEVSITVRDDGNGFDPALESEGVGLRAMRERAELLGGTLEVRAAIDEGAVVSAVVPSARGISIATLR